MDFRILGPVEVWTGGKRLALGHARQKSVLAILLLEAGHAIPVRTLIDRIWGTDPPDGALNVLYAYMTRLRKALMPLGIGPVSRSGGYVLAVPSETVDLHRFLRRMEEAASTGDPSGVADKIDEALAEWRGMPFEDVSGPWLTEQRTILATRWQSAISDRNDAYLRCGRHAELVDDLKDLVRTHPVNERLSGHLMLSLYRCGRTAEALEEYQAIRRRLADQLGTEPGPNLRDLHLRMLRNDPELMALNPQARHAMPKPAGLPHDINGFVGRRTELLQLDTALQKANSGRAIVISAVDGTAGVGKSTLAIHWAHRVKTRFPDGILFADLRGFGPGKSASSEQIMDSFLATLGVTTGRIPREFEAKAAMYRSLLHERSMIVFLDNASSAEQVRPLLPGSPSCLVIVTSRTRLSGLVARDRAHRIFLDVLPIGDAVALLTQFVGTSRVAAEPQAARDLVLLCARLPIALCVAGERAAAFPDLDLAELLSQLQSAGSALDLLDAEGDPETAVRAVFSWSYQALLPDAARVFRLLGIHPGPEVSVAAVASLASTSEDEASTLLRVLIRASLVTESSPGQYTLHDLLRVYAGDLALQNDSAEQRARVVERMLDHYLHTGCGAISLLPSSRDPIEVAPPGPGVVVESFTTTAEAQSWFTRRRPVLSALVELANTTGRDRHTWQLAWVLRSGLQHGSHWRELLAAQHLALAATRRLKDRNAEALAHRNIAGAHNFANRYDEGRSHFLQALRIYQGLGDRNGEAHSQLGLAYIANHEGRYTDGLEHALGALAALQDVGGQYLRARTLNACGWFYAQLGDFQQAIAVCQQALPIYQELSDIDGEAGVWDSLGYAKHRLGDHAGAIDCYQQALKHFGAAKEPYGEAIVLAHLAEIHSSRGDRRTALHDMRRALTILTEIDHPDATDVAERIRQLEIG